MKKLIKNKVVQVLQGSSLAQRAAGRVLAGAPDPRVVDFINKPYGQEYGITAETRKSLVRHFEENCVKIKAATGPMLHLVLAREILSLPKNDPGAVIECGCFKGASTASLSRVCGLVGRKLIVCDSFEGLPEETERLHVNVHKGQFGYYEKGMFAGALEEVQSNVKIYGDIKVCQFVKGFFDTSLKQVKEKIALAFLDVNLYDSLRDCLLYIWPLLSAEGKVFTDDSEDLDVLKIFFDDNWWQSTHRCPAPGYVGSGCGVHGVPSLGYAKKLSQNVTSEYQRVPWLHYPDTNTENKNKNNRA